MDECWNRPDFWTLLHWSQYSLYTAIIHSDVHQTHCPGKKECYFG